MGSDLLTSDWNLWTVVGEFTTANTDCEYIALVDRNRELTRTLIGQAQSISMVADEERGLTIPCSQMTRMSLMLRRRVITG